MKRVPGLLTLLLLLGGWLYTSTAQTSVLGRENAVRIAEARHILGHLQSSDEWPWKEVPFPILLLTEEKDFLVGHPLPTADFTSEGIDPVIGLEVFSRPRTPAWSLQFLATFPAVDGLSTVVVGTAEATGLPSTAWVVTLLHEHFHQIQYSDPDYNRRVAALELDGGDTSGMWMLNYAFPYADGAVAAEMHALASTLGSDLLPTSRAEHVVTHLRRLKSMLPPADYRYLTFQFWQEGTARFIETEVARLAASGYRPSQAFLELADATDYATYRTDLERTVRSTLASVNVPEQGRLVMYPLGAALARVLDETKPGWASAYFNDALSTAKLLDPDL